MTRCFSSGGTASCLLLLGSEAAEDLQSHSERAEQKSSNKLLTALKIGGVAVALQAAVAAHVWCFV